MRNILKKLTRRFAPILIGLLGLNSAGVYAGAQRYEKLSDAVQHLLAESIDDVTLPALHFDTPENRIQYLPWLARASEQLQVQLPEKTARAAQIGLLETVYYESTRAGLEPSLVLAIIQVESRFRKYAVSSAGARGYMQVMPFWVRLIGHGDERVLFETRSNLRYGCTILRHYLDLEKGNLFMALGRYNGSRGQSTYPQLVLRSWKKWQSIAE